MTHVQLSATRAAPPAPADALRQVVRADAVLTAIAGVALLAAASPLADEMGLTTTGPILAAGAFFVVLAAAVAFLGRASDPRLLRVVPANAAGDVAWAAASAVVALAADLSRSGRVLLLIQAAAVLAVGAAKLILTGRARPRP